MLLHSGWLQRIARYYSSSVLHCSNIVEFVNNSSCSVKVSVVVIGAMETIIVVSC